ncbi:MAG TPA: anthranilate phosphoribosyltransferase [Dehalococcoidia bacterium]|nr:anthranilate phosphoribosyltransferase [Dehalococcoidia bacterium]
MTTRTMDPEAIKPYLRAIGQGPTQGRALSRDEAREALAAILDGLATPAQAGGFLLLQRYKGETSEELLGFVDAVRDRAELIAPAVEGLVDIGSPYDGRDRHLVVSPAASIVAAAAGAPQALHGEPGIGPKAGLTVGAVLEALGVPVDQPPAEVQRCLETLGIAYLRQSRFVPALAALKPLRNEIGLRTPLNTVEKIYNLAGAPYHLIGLTHLPYLDKIGGALTGLGFVKTLLVQGIEGNEDCRTSRPTRIIEVTAEGTTEWRLDPAQYGLTPAGEADLAFRDAAGCARFTEETLSGDAPPAHRDLVALNAGLRLYLGNRARDVAEGIALAREAIASGAARALLERWRAMT